MSVSGVSEAAAEVDCITIARTSQHSHQRGSLRPSASK